jgi:hypothetical protein
MWVTESQYLYQTWFVISIKVSQVCFFLARGGVNQVTPFHPLFTHAKGSCSFLHPNEANTGNPIPVRIIYLKIDNFFLYWKKPDQEVLWVGGKKSRILFPAAEHGSERQTVLQYGNKTAPMQ